MSTASQVNPEVSVSASEPCPDPLRIGIAMGGTEDQFFLPQRVLAGLVRHLGKQGRRVELFTGDPLALMTQREKHAEHFAQFAAILVPTTVQPPLACCELFEQCGRPVLWLFLRRPNNALVLDEAEAGQRLVQHLYDQGHRYVAYLDFNGGAMPSAHTVERLRGVHRMARQLRVDVTAFTEHRVPRRERHAFARAWLRNADRPSSVIVDTASAARVLLDTAHLMNISVPDDLAIATFDDGRTLNTTVPTLTGAVSPMWELGRIAADMLENLIHSPTQTIETRAVNYSIWPGGSTDKAMQD